MLPELNTYNWAEVFGEGTGGNCGPIIPNKAPPFIDISVMTFRRENVEKIIGQVEGVNDEESWVVYGQLKDKRYFVARGSCDYTGWDCQASNSGDVAYTQKDIERYGLNDDERTRFGIVLKPFDKEKVFAEVDKSNIKMSIYPYLVTWGWDLPSEKSLTQRFKSKKAAKFFIQNYLDKTAILSKIIK